MKFLIGIMIPMIAASRGVEDAPVLQEEVGLLLPVGAVREGGVVRDPLVGEAGDEARREAHAKKVRLVVALPVAGVPGEAALVVLITARESLDSSRSDFNELIGFS